MKELYLSESDTFTGIQLDEIAQEQPTFDLFYELIHKITCIHRYIAGVSLSSRQKKELYCMAVSWVNNHSKEKDRKKISAILDLNIASITQLDDSTIEQGFLLLEKILAKYSIIWFLLDNTHLLLEKEAKKLVTYAQPNGPIQTDLYRERGYFKVSAKKFIKSLIGDPLERNKRAWIDTYVRMMEKHFDYWSQKSSIPFKEDLEHPLFIDLTHLNLQGLNLSHIPLKNANLSHSRLAGSQFSRTKVSAVQLSMAKEFTRIVDIQPELRLEAQNKYFQLWQQRLKKRMEQFHDVNAKISASQLEEIQELSAFELAIKQRECLLFQQRALNKHIAAHAFEPSELDDLRAEQRNAIQFRLAEIEEKEIALKNELHRFIYEAECTVCRAYFEEIGDDGHTDNLSKILRQFDEILALRIPDKENTLLPPDLEAKIPARRNQLLHLELLSLEPLFRSFTTKDSDLIYNALQHVHSVIHKTSKWALPLEIELTIIKMERDWIKHKILVEIERGNLSRAKKLIATLLSVEGINRQSNLYFIELKQYEIDFTDQYLELKATGDLPERNKIYISKQNECLSFNSEGHPYRWALSIEQCAMVKKLPDPSIALALRQSILVSASRQPYLYLKLELKLKIVEKFIEKGDLDSACSEMREVFIDAAIQKHTLDLRGRSLFRNKAFWENLSIQNVQLYLDYSQAQALGEQRMGYNEALFRAIENGDLEQIKYGIQYFYWNTYLRNKEGCTSVIFACLQGHYDIALYLSDMGGEVVLISPPGKADINPLDELVQKCRKDKARYEPIILWLIKQNIVLEPKNALFLNNEALFNMSLEQFAQDDSRKEKMRELLEMAVKEGSDTVVRSMLKYEHHRECVTSFPKVESKGGIFSLFSRNIEIPQDPPLLHIACAAGQISIVLLLLEDPNTAGSIANRQSALHYLAQLFLQNYPEPTLYKKWKLIAIELCRYGAQHNLLTVLILSTNLKEVAQHINEDTINKAYDTKEYMSLDLVAKIGNKENMPLHLAATTGNVGLVQFLINNKAKLEAINLNGETPLSLACEQCHLDVITCLLEANASPDGPRRTLTSDEKAHLIALLGTFPEMKTLLSTKPLLLNKKTPLQQAIWNKKLQVVRILCQHKADLEAKHRGKTALHIAIEIRDTDSVAILLQYHANLFARNDNDESPWQAAVRTQHIGIMILLLDAYVHQSTLENRAFTQKGIFEHLPKEEFGEALVQWALNLKKQLLADGTEDIKIPLSMPAPLSASPLSLSSSASSSSLASSSSSPSSSSSSLSSSFSMFPPAKSSEANKPLGDKFDVYLSRHSPKEEEKSMFHSGPEYDDDELEELYHHPLAPPESAEPFYVISSDSEEIEEEKAVGRNSPGRFGK